MYEIEICENRKGESKLKDYIRDLQKRKDKDSNIKINKIISYIRMLKQYGISLGEPYIKHIEENIWELRPLKYRILFAYLDNNKFILLNMFIKQTQKTPKKEIEKAKKMINENMNGEDENE